MKKIDYSKLLGFATVSDRPSIKIDFRDDTIGAKLGAKVGVKEMAALDLSLSVLAPPLSSD